MAGRCHCHRGPVSLQRRSIAAVGTTLRARGTRPWLRRPPPLRPRAWANRGEEVYVDQSQNGRVRDAALVLVLAVVAVAGTMKLHVGGMVRFVVECVARTVRVLGTRCHLRRRRARGQRAKHVLSFVGRRVRRKRSKRRTCVKELRKRARGLL